jgi:hypothetical protein
VASETARWAVVDRNPYAPAQSLQQHAQSSATREFASRAEVCIDFPLSDTSDPDDDVELGEPVHVSIEVPVAFAGFFGIDVTINGSSTMRVERLGNGKRPAMYTETCA